MQIRSHAQKFFSKLEKQQKQLQAGLQPTISESRLKPAAAGGCRVPCTPLPGPLHEACTWLRLLAHVLRPPVCACQPLRPPPPPHHPPPLLPPSPPGGVPVDLEVPPPRPKRKSSKPYPHPLKVDGFSDIVNQASLRWPLASLVDMRAVCWGSEPHRARLPLKTTSGALRCAHRRPLFVPPWLPLQAGQLSLQALPDYAALVKSGGEVTDVTVAAVTAAASAAAAAAAAAVVAAAGKEIETKLQVRRLRAGWAACISGMRRTSACKGNRPAPQPRPMSGSAPQLPCPLPSSCLHVRSAMPRRPPTQACPPSVFPFYGLTPAMLRAMSNPATIQANIQVGRGVGMVVRVPHQRLHLTSCPRVVDAPGEACPKRVKRRPFASSQVVLTSYQ